MALALGGLLIAGASTSTAANTDVTGVFELDGNIANDTTSTPPDWQNLFTAGDLNTAPTTSSLPDHFVNAKFFRDFTPGSTADSTTYATGSKDTLPISGGWQCKKSNNVTDKGDIQNTYMAAYRDPSNNHLVVFAGLEKNAPNGNNNMAVWLLRDGSVNCDSSSGGNVDFTGHHENGDLLLVAAFLNGGTNPVINAYEWVGDGTGSLNTTALGTGGKCGATGSEDLCAITNDTNLTGIPWYTVDKNFGTDHSLGADQFYEMGADVTALGLNECFANYLANTRSSQELGATLYDFAGGQAPTCGSLTVDKYIDVNMDGSLNTGDVTSGTVVAGWSFTITGPNGFSCTGTTTSTAGALGTVDCSASTSTADQARTDLTNLLPGSYTVTETQKSHYFNTDPGPLPDASLTAEKVNDAPTASKTFTMGTTNKTVDLGNTCFVNKTFQITGVPTGTTAPSSIKVDWAIGKGHYGSTATSGTVTLAPASSTSSTTTWSGSLDDVFTQDSVITWDWYVNGDSAHKVNGATNETVGGGYPTCADTNTGTMPLTSVQGHKYKDVSNFGTLNTTGDNPDVAQSGFTFQLFAGKNPAAGATPLQTAKSGTDGKYTFTNGVAPGTYTIREVQETGWLQTLPASSGDREVTVYLGDSSATVGDFLNTPLSNIGATFTPQAKNPPGGTTDATQATIACTDADGNTVGSQTGNSLSAKDLKIGTYTCTVTITDP